MPIPVPTESVRLKIEKMAPRFSGTFVSRSIVRMFGPVIEAKNAARKPRTSVHRMLPCGRPMNM